MENKILLLFYSFCEERKDWCLYSSHWATSQMAINSLHEELRIVFDARCIIPIKWKTGK